MHDDQHGTAIISSAGLVNALQVAGKKIEDVKIIRAVGGKISLLFVEVGTCLADNAFAVQHDDIFEACLKEELDIPVMHDDQHGTAIISSAGLVNALQVAGKKIEDVKIVVNGAGASAVSCTKLYVSLGARLENIVMGMGAMLRTMS